VLVEKDEKKESEEREGPFDDLASHLTPPLTKIIGSVGHATLESLSVWEIVSLRGWEWPLQGFLGHRVGPGRPPNGLQCRTSWGLPILLAQLQQSENRKEDHAVRRRQDEGFQEESNKVSE
jgi:hypothetical protein